MFWSIFLQSLFLILLIVVVGRVISALLSRNASSSPRNDGKGG